jgi:DeoR/GlpR family transcriptional regulator of sugar metabolism
VARPDVTTGEERSPLTAERRRNAIRAALVATGGVRTDELADRFGVAIMTIHRDLAALEDQRWLRRVRGGDVVEPSARIDTTVRYRMAAAVEEKRQIARCALEHVTRPEALIVDDSTTTLSLVRLLPGRGPLTVITNFLPSINALAGEPGIELIALGGSYSSSHDRFGGLHTREAMDWLRADTLFMSSTAVMDDGVLYHTSPDSVVIRRAFMDAAARRILLMDHSKFARRAVHRLGPLTDFDLVIVDAGIAERDLTMMRDRGVAVEVASAHAEPAGNAASAHAEPAGNAAPARSAV